MLQAWPHATYLPPKELTTAMSGRASERVVLVSLTLRGLLVVALLLHGCVNSANMLNGSAVLLKECLISGLLGLVCGYWSLLTWPETQATLEWIASGLVVGWQKCFVFVLTLCFPSFQLGFEFGMFSLVELNPIDVVFFVGSRFR